MPWSEALNRAGSLEMLLPHLRAGRILARHHGLYHWPEGSKWESDGEISPDMLDDAREDPDTGRVILTQEFQPIIGTLTADLSQIIPPSRPPLLIKVFAMGVELEREAIERLFPAPRAESDNTAAAVPATGGRPLINRAAVRAEKQRRLDAGEKASHKELARHFGCSPKTIGRCLKK